MSPISPAQARLQDDLRGLVEGDVFCDDISLQLYACDAGLFSIRPAGVVRPRSRKDVIACVKYAEEKGLPLHPRGAGTGRSGAAVGPGVVLDFSRYMRRMIRFDDHSVTAQAGMTRTRLNKMLQKQQNRMLGPVSGFPPTTTLGSMFACNGAGTHWLRYGFMYEHLLSAEIVLAGGEVLELSSDSDGNPQVTNSILHAKEKPQGFVHEHADSSIHPAHLGPHPSEKSEEPDLGTRLRNGVREILLPHLAEIRFHQGKRGPDRSGYRLHGVVDTSSEGELRSDRVDLLRLLCGSEGTLGIVTEMQLKSVPVPPHRGSVLLLFDSLEKAARSVTKILPFEPCSCEMLDRRRLNMLREWDKRFQGMIPRETEAALLLECDGESARDIGDKLNAVVDSLRFEERLSFGSRVAFDEKERSLFGELLRKGEQVLARMPKTFRAIPLFEGVFVPVEKLPEFLVIVQNIFKRYGIFASFFGHVGHGHLQIDPIISLMQENPGEVLLRLAEEVYEEIIRHGGSISCNGDCGLVSTRFLPRQSGSLFPLFQKIKTLFDPGNFLNPGKIIPEAETDWKHALRFSFNEPKTE